ncbi:MAG: pyridoxal-phosphate-dependent aminotransferase family protein [Candidatus Odinarchaeota archaeon]
MRTHPLMMVPGPVACHPEVLKALAAQPLHPRDSQFVTIFRRVLQGLRGVFRAAECQPVLFNGGGLLAMEVALANFIEPKDHILIVNNGFFGEELVHVAKCYSRNVESLTAPIGERVPLEEIQVHLDSKPFQVLAVSHVDTGSGVKAQIHQLVQTAQNTDTLTIVDAVSSVGGEPLEQSQWGIDVCFASTQKAIAGPPGIALLMLSDGAMRRLDARQKPISSIYMNLKQWIRSMQSYEAEAVPRLVSTPATNLVAALSIALHLIQQEGLEQRIQRHHQNAQQLREGISSLGLKLVPKHSDYFADTITTIHSARHTTATKIVKHMLNQGVRIAPGLGQSREDLFRIGHMGNVTSKDVSVTLSALKKVLTTL